MKTLAVPAALPRSEAGTRVKIAANTAGVRNATPTASTAEPTSRLHAAGTAAAMANPTVQAPRPPGGQTHRRKPVGQPGEQEPATHDNSPIHQKDHAPGLEPNISRVQRSEGEEAGRACHPGEQPETRQECGAVNQRRRRRRDVGSDQRLRDTCGENRSYHREERDTRPHQVEPSPPE